MHYLPSKSGILLVALTAAVLSGATAGPLRAGDAKLPLPTGRIFEPQDGSTGKGINTMIDPCEGSQPSNCPDGCKPHETLEKCVPVEGDRNK